MDFFEDDCEDDCVSVCFAFMLCEEICEDVKLQIGANNLFNEYPDQQDDWVEGGGYWDAVQMGFGGAYYYAQMAFSF